MSGRGLTNGEIALLRTVYGDSLNYQMILIDSIYNPTENAFTINNLTEKWCQTQFPPPANSSPNDAGLRSISPLRLVFFGHNFSSLKIMGLPIITHL